MIVVHVPKHYLVGIARVPRPGDAFIEYRGEPFVLVRGKLAKDDGTVNVLAEEVRGLQCDIKSPDPAPRAPAAFSFLRAMRRVAPDSKDWG